MQTNKATVTKELLPAAVPPLVQPVRGRYVDWRMLRDVKRRQLVKQYAPERLRVSAVRKNTILPREIQVPCASAIDQLNSFLFREKCILYLLVCYE